MELNRRGFLLGSVAVAVTIAWPVVVAVRSTTFHVDLDASGPSGDGSWWGNLAFHGQDGLAAAFASAKAGDTIYIKSGAKRDAAASTPSDTTG